MNDLPRPIVVLAALVIITLLVVNIVADIFRDDYEAYATTLVLAGLLGGMLGLDRVARRAQLGQRRDTAPTDDDETKAGA